MSWVYSYFGHGFEFRASDFEILAGKTGFSAKHYLGYIIACKARRVFYLVPTKALAEEKFEQFSEDYEKASIRTVISTHDRTEFHGRIKQNEHKEERALDSYPEVRYSWNIERYEHTEL